MLIRPIRVDDVPAVQQIAEKAFLPAYRETTEVLTARIECPQAKCLLAECDNTAAGYVVSFPDIMGLPYPMHVPMSPVHNPNCQYIHALAVLPAFRHRGIGTHLLRLVLDLMPWGHCTLMAYQSTDAFWKRFGFQQKLRMFYCGEDTAYLQYDRPRHDAV